MAKARLRKPTRHVLPDPELANIAFRKRTQKRIAAGYREVGRLARQIRATRARVEEELQAFAASVLMRSSAPPPADDSLEGSHG